MRLSNKQVKEFLRESNAIEGVYSDEALNDALNAWEYAYRERKHGFSLEYILHIHRMLMINLDPSIAGKLRDCDVWIGGKKNWFISTALLKEDLRDWCEFANAIRTDSDYIPQSTLDDATRSLHVDFEDIHPFRDGNGRTGRILWNINRLLCGLPIQIIHEGKEQRDYYKWFNESI